MSASTARSSSPLARRLGHRPDLLRELGEVGVVHLLQRLREAEALQRQPDRDQHLLDLLLGDAEHDRAAVRVRDDEALVLELAQRLAHGAAARVQLGRDPLLDQPVAVGEPADRDRLAQVVDDVLAARAALLALPRAPAPPASAPSASRLDVCADSAGCVKGIVDNLRIVDNPMERALAYTRSCGSQVSKRLRSGCRSASRSSGPAASASPRRDSSSRSRPTRASSASARRPGRRCPSSRRSSSASSTQFLVGEDPLRLEWLLHRMEEYSRNWASIAAYAIAGIEMALLDIKGKALGVPVAELLGGMSPHLGAGDRLPLHRRARGERRQGGRVRRGRPHRAEAQGRPRPRPGLRHDRGDPRPRRDRTSSSASTRT